MKKAVGVRKVGDNREQTEAPAVELPTATTRNRILQVALELLTLGGRDALTTRGVAEAAGVQPPALYRLFRDKRGLLDALSDHGYALYLSEKRVAKPDDDPVQFLRSGWDKHVRFGLSHPELYLLMYADPRPSTTERSGRHAHTGLRAHMTELAIIGRLRVSENLATDLFHAAACGVVLSLLRLPEDCRDLALSTSACDAILAAILTEHTSAGVNTHLSTAAIALRAQLTVTPDMHDLTAAEKSLLFEWLAKLSERTIG